MKPPPMPRRSFAFVGALALALPLAGAPSAAAQRPIAEELALTRVSMPERPRATVTPLFENDNKLFGLWQLWAEDGDDDGRTHGAVLGVDVRLTEELDLWVEYQTSLFTEQVRDQYGLRVRLDDDLVPHPSRRKDRHIHFAELDYFRAGTHYFLHELGVVFSFGAGALVRNRERVTMGGTGQQRGFHNFLEVFDHDVKEYRYIDDGGGIQWGGVFDGAVGVRRRVWQSRKLRFSLDGGVGVWLSTIPDGAYAGLHFGAELGMGKRRAFDLPIATLRAAQYVEAYVASSAVLLDTRVQLDFHTRVADVVIWFDAYTGDPNDAFYVYNYGNTTTTLGFVFRLP